MIKNFKHKGLKKLFETGSAVGVEAVLAKKLTRQLDRLDASLAATDMNLPGWGFHELKGNRRGTFSVKVSGNWRLTFKFADGDAFEVNLEDYH